MQKVEPADSRFMRLALRVAEKGIGRVHPNPLVGAVLVHKKKLLSQGFHAYFGGPHAEVAALRQLKNIPEGSTLYTTLEPCSHFGKTPPCADLIISTGVRRVVVGAKDPNPKVHGRGIARLKAAGLEVRTGIFEKEALELNKDFNWWVKNKTPYVIVKVAQTLNGKIATKKGEPRWITGPKARRFGHHLRERSDAVLVGVNTVLTDNPRLNVRLAGTHSDPLKVVLDSKLRSPLKARLFKTQGRVLIFTSRKTARSRVKTFSKKATVIQVREKREGVLDWKEILKVLGGRGVTNLLIEGGAQVIASALQAGIVRECYVFIAPRILGGDTSPSIARTWDFKHSNWMKVGDDLLLHGIF